MVTKEKVVETVFNILEEVNGHLPQESHVEKSVDAVLIGASSTLNSMGFVFLVVATEQKMIKEFGVKVALADDNSIFSEGTPFQTVGTFIDYLLDILNKEKIQCPR